MDKGQQTKKPIRQQPWGYKESFIIAIELLIIGFIFEILSKGKGVILLRFPANLIIGVAFLFTLIIINRFRKENKFLNWLSSTPAAISSITLFCLLALLLGFIPQNPQNPNKIISLTGLDHVQRSWPILMAELYLLTVLGLVALRRLKPLNTKNLGFLMNHGGMWITLFAMTLGSGDLLRLKLKLVENEKPKDMVVDGRLKLYKLPFKAKLLDFDIEEYPPKLAFIESNTKKIVSDITNNLTLLEKGLKIPINEWEFEIMEYYAGSKKQDSIFIISDEFGARASALVRAKNVNTGKITEGWIAPAILARPFEYLKIDSLHSITLTVPEPKVYSSLIEIIDKNNNSDTILIEVNKPHSVKGWKLYQVGYEQQMGRWSPVSILEVVYDPWLPVIYTGIFMLIIGGIYILWIGKDK